MKDVALGERDILMKDVALGFGMTVITVTVISFTPVNNCKL
jgi:hypothetical protein